MANTSFAALNADLSTTVGTGALVAADAYPTVRLGFAFDLGSSDFPRYRLGVVTGYHYFGDRLAIDGSYIARTFSFLSFKYRFEQLSERNDSVAVQLRVGYGSRSLFSSTRFHITPAFGVAAEYRLPATEHLSYGLEIAYEYMSAFNTQLRNHRGIDFRDYFASNNGSAHVPDAHIFMLSLVGYFSFF